MFDGVGVWMIVFGISGPLGVGLRVVGLVGVGFVVFVVGCCLVSGLGLVCCVFFVVLRLAGCLTV